MALTVSDSQPPSPRLPIPSACTVLNPGLATLSASGSPSMLRIVIQSRLPIVKMGENGTHDRRARKYLS